MSRRKSNYLIQVGRNSIVKTQNISANDNVEVEIFITDPNSKEQHLQSICILGCDSYRDDGTVEKRNLSVFKRYYDEDFRYSTSERLGGIEL